MDISKDMIEKAQGGDAAAFEEIYRQTSGFVYNVALRMSKNTHDAQEITQEVFVKVYRYLDHFRFEASFKTWIFRVSMNETMNYCKNRSKKRMRETAVDDEQILDHLSGGQETRQNDQDALMKLVDELNPEQKICMILRAVEGLSYQEIADVLGVNINTVRTRLKRGREFLIKRFPQKEVD